MRRMKILHVQLLPIMSGVQKAMVDILVRMDSEVYEIHVLCGAEGELTDVLRRYGIKCHVISAFRRQIQPYYDIIAFLKLFKLLKAERYDLVHTHSSKPGIIGRFASKFAGVRCIVHTVQGFAFHEQSSKLRVFLVGFLEKIAGMAAHKVIFVNNVDRNTAAELKLLPKDKMVTIYNGIDLSFFKSRNGAQGLHDVDRAEKHGALVAMVARLWQQKAPQYFIACIPKVVQKIPQARFLVIGDGPLREELEKRCEELGIGENVFFLGWRKDVIDLLKIIDVFVLPSLWEGLPISILEAMAASKPVVATNIKGNRDLVIHGYTGFLVEPKNPEEIADYVLQLLRERALAKKMGRRGYLRVKEKFQINTTVHQITNLYGSLLNVQNDRSKRVTPSEMISKHNNKSNMQT